MFSLKVEHRGKVINLGKALDSMEKVTDELIHRFPIDFKDGVTL